MDRELFYKSMTREERIAYNRSIINNKLNEEETKLLLDNVKLVTFVINKKLHINTEYLNKFYIGIEFDDLFQEGILGAIKGIKTFKFNYYDNNGNQNKGFSAYLVSCIKNEILMYLRKENKKNNVCGFSFDFVVEGNDASIIPYIDLYISDEIIDPSNEIIKELEIEITERIIRRVKEEIINGKYHENTKDIMLFMFNKIIDDLDLFLNITDLTKLYNNENNSTYVKNGFNKIFNKKLRPLIAKICVEEDDTLNYDELINRKRYSY